MDQADALVLARVPLQAVVIPSLRAERERAWKIMAHSFGLLLITHHGEPSVGVQHSLVLILKVTKMRGNVMLFFKIEYVH